MAISVKAGEIRNQGIGAVIPVTYQTESKLQRESGSETVDSPVSSTPFQARGRLRQA
jgi:hypothetical protein